MGQKHTHPSQVQRNFCGQDLFNITVNFHDTHSTFFFVYLGVASGAFENDIEALAS